LEKNLITTTLHGSRRDSMNEDFLKKLTKKYDHMLFVQDESDDKVDVISTGALSIDLSMGIGGIPKGRITTIYGAESSGKTTLCLSLARKAIEQGEKVAYIDVEQSIDYAYAKTMVGDFDISNLLIAQPETAEDSLGLVELLINGDDKLGIPGGQFGLIIVDSVAALAPKREKDKELTDKNVALTSGILTPFFRRNMYGIREKNVALVFVNQVRDNIGAYYGGYVLPGGHALKHYSSIILFLSSGEKFTKDDDIFGMSCKFVVKKNKLAPPFRSSTFPLIFGEGIDYYRDVFEFATMLGVLRKRGSYIYFEDEQLGQGQVKTTEYLKKNPEVLDKIVKLCYDVICKTKVIEEPDEELTIEEIVDVI
jgi:recombination protein RecA